MAQQRWNVFPEVTPDQLKSIVTKPDSAETLVKCAEEIGKALARRLTTSQIRAIFGEVRRIEGEWKTKPATASRNLTLLKPKMAYRARKEQGKGVEELVSVLRPAIDFVGDCEANFNRFVEFFEAILAYHRAYGGK